MQTGPSDFQPVHPDQRRRLSRIRAFGASLERAGAQDDAGERTRLSDVIQTVLAVLVLAVVVILPLVFVPTIDDGYALPKALALRILAIGGAGLFLAFVLAGGALAQQVVWRLDVPLLAFVGLFVIATMASVDPRQSLAGEPYQYQGLVTGLAYIGAFYAARVSLDTPSRFRAALLVMAGTGAVVATYAIAQQLGYDPFWSGPIDARAISSVGQANNLAAYLLLVIVAAVGLWSDARWTGRLVLVGVLGVSVAALGLTYSRGGYLAFGAIILLGVSTIWLAPGGRSASGPGRRRGAFALTVAASILTILIAIPTLGSTVARFADRASATTNLDEGSIRMHLDLWRVGSQIAIEHPVLGTGPETFPLVFRTYLEVLPPDRATNLARFRAESPHNELIGIAAEMGLPAAAAFLAFLIAVAMVGYRAVRSTAASSSQRWIGLVVLGVLTIHVVTTSFMTPEVSTSALFWILCGAGVAATRTARPEPGRS